MQNYLPTRLLIVTFISVLALGCKKKPVEEPIPNNTCETTYEVFFGESIPTGEKATVAYQNGQVKSISSSSLAFVYEYATDRVIVTAAGVPVYRIEIVAGLASKFTDLNHQLEQRLSYDTNRNLVKIESYSNNNLEDSQILAYVNGNLATLTQTFSDSPAVRKVTNFTYSTEIAGNVENEARNLLFGTIDLVIPSSLIGSMSKNILTGSLYTYTSGNFRSDITKTYNYTRNGNGQLNKIVEDSHTLTVSNGTQTQDERLKRTILVNSTCK